MSGTSAKRLGLKWGLAVLLLGLLIANLVVISRLGASGAAAWHGAGAGWRMAARGSAFVISMLLWFWTQSLIGSRSGGDGIGDAVHDWTASWNDYLQARPAVANRILIVSTGFIDLFGVFLIGVGLLGPTLRPFIALLFVFAFRQFCQAVCNLPFPPKMIWRNPGFPSLLVTYGVANDFFISGHTAIAVLGAIEIARILPWWCGVAAGVIALGEAVMVIVLRAHYTMDVLGAAAAAWCAADLAMRLSVALGI